MFRLTNMAACYGLVCKSSDLLIWFSINKFCEKLVIFSKECKLGQIKQTEWSDLILLFHSCLYFVWKVADSSSNYPNDSTPSVILVSLSLLYRWRPCWSRDPLSICIGIPGGLEAKPNLLHSLAGYTIPLEIGNIKILNVTLRKPKTNILADYTGILLIFCRQSNTVLGGFVSLL